MKSKCHFVGGHERNELLLHTTIDLIIRAGRWPRPVDDEYVAERPLFCQKRASIYVGYDSNARRRELAEYRKRPADDAKTDARHTLSAITLSCGRPAGRLLTQRPAFNQLQRRASQRHAGASASAAAEIPTPASWAMHHAFTIKQRDAIDARRPITG